MRTRSFLTLFCALLALVVSHSASTYHELHLLRNSNKKMRPPTASQKVNTRAAQFVQCKNQQRTFLSDLLPSIEAMVSEAYQAVETLEQHAPTEDLAAQENWDPHPGDEVIWMKFIRRFGIIDILMIDRVKSWLGAVLEPLEGVRVFCNGQGNYLAQASTGRRKEIRLVRTMLSPRDGCIIALTDILL